jgi:hypothetical protein
LAGGDGLAHAATKALRKTLRIDRDPVPVILRDHRRRPTERPRGELIKEPQHRTARRERDGAQLVPHDLGAAGLAEQPPHAQPVSLRGGVGDEPPEAALQHLGRQLAKPPHALEQRARVGEVATG